jgi:hypothetical protein
VNVTIPILYYSRINKNLELLTDMYT